MKKLALAAAVLALVLVATAPAIASNYMMGYMGTGSLMKSPVVYSGSFTFGLTGTWSFTLDDSLWPDPADSTARFNYIWDNFFAPNYDPTVGGEAWSAYFDGTTLPSTPTFAFDLTSADSGHVEGSIAIVLVLRDWYADGILSQDEKHGNGSLNATFSLNPQLGTDDFLELCGHGSLGANNFRFVNPPGDNSLSGMGQFSTYECQSPVEDSTWGVIKALYR